jgi:hypothetical protein
MSTLAEMVAMVRNTVYGTRPDLRPKQDRLVNTINDTVTAMEFETPAMWKRDALAEFKANGEVVVLREDHPAATNDVNVFERGDDRGKAAAAQTENDVVLRNPRFLLADIEEKISRAIDGDLWPAVWIRTERTVSGYDPAIETYELNADDVAVEQMYQYDINDDDRFHEFPTQWYDVVGSVADAVPAGATSNRLLRVYQVVDKDHTVYYTAKTKPNSASPTALPEELVEMVVLRASASLLSQAPRERRDRTSGRTRSGEQATDYGLLMAEFTRLRSQYANRLQVELMARKKYRTGLPRGVVWQA